MSTDAQFSGLRRLVWHCAAVLAVLAPPAAPAATFPDLYTVTVDSEPTAADRRSAAVERAMAVLLTRVTGRTEAAAYPELAPIVAAAPQLVTSYGQVDGDRYRVGFNGARVQAQLSALDWPVWGAERPLLVLWAAVDFGDNERALLAADDAAAARPFLLTPAAADIRDSLREELLKAADERGLPLVLPMMDQQDSDYASFAAVWGGFDGLLALASARYAADFTLSARIALTDLGLEIDWHLISPDGTARTLRTSAVREGIDWVADLFAARFSSSGGLRQIRLDIEGVDSLAGYGRVMSYLDSLSIFESIDVASYANDVLELSASVRGDDTVVDRVFELGGVLEPAAAESPQGIGGADPFAPAGPRRYVIAGSAVRGR